LTHRTPAVPRNNEHFFGCSNCGKIWTMRISCLWWASQQILVIFLQVSLVGGRMESTLQRRNAYIELPSLQVHFLIISSLRNRPTSTSSSSTLRAVWNIFIVRSIDIYYAYTDLFQSLAFEIIHSDIRAVSSLGIGLNSQLNCFPPVQSNILVNEKGRACLADPGLLKVLDGIKCSMTQSGVHLDYSYAWMAPELLRVHDKPPLPFSRETDIYAFTMTSFVRFHPHSFLTQVA